MAFRACAGTCAGARAITGPEQSASIARVAIERPILLAGAGNMGAALAKGWLARGLSPERLIVQDPAPKEEIASLLQKAGVRFAPAFDALEPLAAILLAVKPQVMEDVLPGLARHAGKETLILSVAAGKRIESIARHFSPDSAIIRAMPNTPAAIGEGMTVLCKNATVTSAQEDFASLLLSAVGDVAWVPDEDMMDAVTAVSGSGPAYVFLLAECLAEAGQRAGLEEKLAARIARKTIAGAGAMLTASAKAAGDLRGEVTSPGGTTAAALSVLTGPDGFPALLTKAVAAAAKRSRELGS